MIISWMNSTTIILIESFRRKMREITIKIRIAKLSEQLKRQRIAMNISRKIRKFMLFQGG